MAGPSERHGLPNAYSAAVLTANSAAQIAALNPLHGELRLQDHMPAMVHELVARQTTQ